MAHRPIIPQPWAGRLKKMGQILPELYLQAYAKRRIDHLFDVLQDTHNC